MVIIIYVFYNIVEPDGGLCSGKDYECASGACYDGICECQAGQLMTSAACVDKTGKILLQWHTSCTHVFYSIIFQRNFMLVKTNS